MILLDTSVWIDHLRRGDPTVVRLLESGLATTHPFVVGELACGNLRSRSEILGLLRALPTIDAATDDEVLHIIESRKLMGQGIGYIDAHLLASVVMNGARLWTRDRRLRKVAAALGVEHEVGGK